jgi:hypothetical protein|tara:strand:+ start:162 stop:329 length:168 start_codon:yes stop_codon:yes gene_type:complete
MTINDRVKVIDQNITGIIVEDYGNTVVIIDDDSEIVNDRLEFKKSELKLIQTRKD